MKTRKTNSMRLYILVEIIIVVAMFTLIVYNGISTYKSSEKALSSIGENSLAREKEQVKAYLYKAMDTLEVTAVSVDTMIANNEDVDKVYNLFHAETIRFQEDYDENFTGVYGYIDNCYIDGTDWVPPADYDPYTRDWYTYAKEANGDLIIVPPYLDAQTGSVLISISRLLSDGESVVSLDVGLDEVQSITENINMNGSGYGLIIDNSGLIIAHSDKNEIGKNMQDDAEKNAIFEKVLSSEQGQFEIEYQGEKVTVFYENVIHDWYSIMVVSNSTLYHNFWTSVTRNSIVCIVVFLFVVVFITYAFRNVIASAKQAEDSRNTAEHMYLAIVQTLAQAIDAKDKYTNGHSQRVGQYSREIAKRMGKSEQEIDDIYYAALLHDVGKIRIPDTIINKTGKLTDEEYYYMKLHPVAGFHILKYVKENSLISMGAKEHHERFDGKGYPNGLIGENISEIGRIIAVADAYDAMTSNRSYRNIMEQSRVRDQIEKGKGEQFDPTVADIMLQMIDEDTSYQMHEQTRFQKNILIVDDDSLQHDLLEYLLKDEPGYVVHWAASGAQALEKVKNTEIDVILLDIQMPDMDGFETCAELQKISTIPIVFLTGDPSRENMQRAYDMGVVDYLVKPYNNYAIKEVLHSLLRANI